MSEQAEVERLGRKPNRGTQRDKTRPHKKSNKNPKAPVKRAAEVFLYLCQCHGQRASKVPCEKRASDTGDNKFSESTLGKWRCMVTQKKCKVDRRKPIPVEEEKSNG